MDDGYYARLLESVDQQERRERELLAMRRSTAAAGAEIRSELISTLEQIEKDVGRTFPGHRTFTHSADGQAQLRRVLRAYCAGRNLHTGYCQGMNFVAATLLLVMSTEEDAFWMFLLTMERLLPADRQVRAPRSRAARQHGTSDPVPPRRRPSARCSPRRSGRGWPRPTTARPRRRSTWR